MRRVASKGNAGLEPVKDAEESFWLDKAICDGLREWLREIEAGRQEKGQKKQTKMRPWQEQVMKDGVQGRLDL